MYLKKRKTFSGENLVAGSKSLWVEETRVPGEKHPIIDPNIENLKMNNILDTKTKVETY
jgi:hypothetical protein